MEQPMELSVGQKLHARSVNGDALSADERRVLEAWYAEQDAEEHALLSRSRNGDNESLRKQIADALSQISIVADRIRELDLKNEVLFSGRLIVSG
jgi:hypothetical protein